MRRATVKEPYTAQEMLSELHAHFVMGKARPARMMVTEGGETRFRSHYALKGNGGLLLSPMGMFLVDGLDVYRSEWDHGVGWPIFHVLQHQIPAVGVVALDRYKPRNTRLRCTGVVHLWQLFPHLRFCEAIQEWHDFEGCSEGGLLGVCNGWRLRWPGGGA